MNWGSNSRLQAFWDIRAACNFIGGGTGCGLLIWAATGLYFGLPYFPAAFIGLLFVAGGLLMVWLEIGKPWRALNVFFRPQTSWMTREGILSLPLFATGAIAVLAAVGRDLQIPVVPSSPVVPAVLTAFIASAFLYCQLRILHSARSIPAWREPKAMVLFGVSGLLEGLGVLLILTSLSGAMSTTAMVAALILLAARALAWRSYVAALRRSPAAKSALVTILPMHNGFLMAGHWLPGSMIVIAYLWPAIAVPLAALAGLAATGGGWWLKATLITKAAYIPRATLPLPPIRGRPGPANAVPNALASKTNCK